MSTDISDYVQDFKDDTEAVTLEKLKDVDEAPGVPIEFDPPEMELAGAVFDDAVSADDAFAAVIDAV